MDLRCACLLALALATTVFAVRSQDKSMQQHFADEIAKAGSANNGERFDLSSTEAVGQTNDTKTIATQDKDVDFSFMGKDRRYPGHNAGLFGSMKEWFGGRATDDKVKEEIVMGHFCAERGSRDETYFASSFCYWMPEILSASDVGNRHRAPNAPGLAWKGGDSKLLINYPRSSGQCVMSAVCHNNAIDANGAVSKSGFVMNVGEPQDCLKEKEIERRCVAVYDESVKEVKKEDSRCRGVQERFDSATAALSRCVQALDRLPRQISEIPNLIQKVRYTIANLDGQVRQAEDHERSERRQMKRRCNNYKNERNMDRMMDMLDGSDSTARLLGMLPSFHCRRPHMPMNKAADDNAADWHRAQMSYRRDLDVYNACKECDSAKDDLKRAHKKISDIQHRRDREARRIPEYQRKHDNLESELRKAQFDEKGLRWNMRSMTNEWQPQRPGCEKTYYEYANGKASSVVKCAPQYYKDSCERACIETSYSGCGVVEGARPGDHVEQASGSVHVSCEPPQPSWILGPFTYGAKESKSSQCGRIQEHQSVKYAQKTLKAGYLWKKGRNGGWDMRYFMLESGDDVRSALLRYWTKDPTKLKAEEKAGKGVILQDAKGVKAKKGSKYGFKNGEECFKIQHFYRDYRLCVPNATDRSVALGEEKSGQEDRLRDEWVEEIGANIGKQ
jgi:predicted  nucleic acid-binding Zn-ribbon protein